jgi:hypothetical protein
MRSYVTSRQKKHSTGRSSKMAESLPYGIVPHGFYWPLLGQKSSHQKSYRTEILSTIARAIVTRAVALRDGLTLLWRPNI